jgi:hypothetical protein
MMQKKGVSVTALLGVVSAVVCIVVIAAVFIFNSNLDLPLKFAYSGMAVLIAGVVFVVLHGVIATKATRKITIGCSCVFCTAGIVMLYISAGFMSENVRLIELVILSVFVVIIAFLLFTARRKTK